MKKFKSLCLSYYFVAALCHAFTIEISQDMEMDNCTNFLDLIEVSETTIFKRVYLYFTKTCAKTFSTFRKRPKYYQENGTIILQELCNFPKFKSQYQNHFKSA